MPWGSGESDSAAILDDGVAWNSSDRRHVDAAMHPELSTGYDDGAVFHAGDVGWSVRLATMRRLSLTLLMVRLRMACVVLYRNVHHAVSERYDDAGTGEFEAEAGSICGVHSAD